MSTEETEKAKLHITAFITVIAVLAAVGFDANVWHVLAIGMTTALAAYIVLTFLDTWAERQIAKRNRRP